MAEIGECESGLKISLLFFILLKDEFSMSKTDVFSTCLGGGGEILCEEWLNSGW
jgi:hypothetical protein